LIAGEADVINTVKNLQRSAEHYRASFHVAPEAGHNVQMDVGYRETALHIARWLKTQEID
jgi:pimeloyl-ACP methyl ester carboxylesterase